jgi:hypothetical protein
MARPSWLRARADAIPTSVRWRLRPIAVWIRHRGLGLQDQMLASYPKSGNTWLKFMIGQLAGGSEVDFDSVQELVPGIGEHVGAPGIVRGGGRLITTHEPYRRDYVRAIYLVRDPRDVAISYYYHQLRQGRYAGNLSDFLTGFARGRIDPYGGWGRNVASWLASPLATNQQLILLKYEDMRADPVGTLTATTGFLGMASDSADVAAAVEANRMERMRDKEGLSKVVIQPKRTDIPVVRKGKVGEWREAFSAREVAMFDDAFGSLVQQLGYDRS